MVVIFEGIDKTGKSTLARKISNTVNYKILRVFDKQKKEDTLYSISKHFRDFNFPVNDYYEDLIITETLSQMKDVNVILDRTVVSGDVYRKLCGKREIPKEIMEWWYKKLESMNALYIWVDSSYEDILERYERLPDEILPITENAYNFLKSRFQEHMENIEGRIKSIRFLNENKNTEHQFNLDVFEIVK